MAAPTQYEIIRSVLDDENIETDALVTNQHADNLAAEIAAALDAAGYVIRKKPKARAEAAPVEVFSPNTGNPELDAFMRDHHDPKYKPLPMPKGETFRGYGGTGKLPDAQRMRLEEEWRREIEKCVREGERAIEPLRDAIAIHRSPWKPTGETGTIEGDTRDNWAAHASENHPGVTLWTTGAAAHLIVDGEKVDAPGFSFPILGAMREADRIAAERAA